MQIKLENIGIVKNSSIELNGLTVITGKNNSGKSTVGKTLYALLDAVSNISEKYEIDRYNYMVKILEENQSMMSVFRLIKYGQMMEDSPTDDDILRKYSYLKKYINKELFKGHWAYDYIVPIYNSPDLENVMVKAGIKFEKKGDERKKEYIKIFPTDKKYLKNESIELDSFAKNLTKVNETNMENFIEYCIQNS